jgi:hypothetical protein
MRVGGTFPSQEKLSHGITTLTTSHARCRSLKEQPWSDFNLDQEIKALEAHVAHY